MKAEGPREERETVIRFSDADDTAEIWTASDIIDRRLRRLGIAILEEGERHTVFSCPKRQVRISRPRVMTDAQKASLAQKLHKRGFAPIATGPK